MKILTENKQRNGVADAKIRGHTLRYDGWSRLVSDFLLHPTLRFLVLGQNDTVHVQGLGSHRPSQPLYQPVACVHLLPDAKAKIAEPEARCAHVYPALLRQQPVHQRLIRMPDGGLIRHQTDSTS